MDRPLMLGISGGSGSGKTYLAKRIAKELGPEHASVVSMDQYFRTTHEEGSSVDLHDINFDHPGRIDWESLLQDLQILKSGVGVCAPSYDFRLQRQIPGAVSIQPTPVVIAEGLFVLAEPLVRVFDVTVFLDVDKDQRLIGRILRDVDERGADVEWTIDRYQRFVRPSYDAFVEPTQQNADIVVNFTYRRAMFQAFLVALLRAYVLGTLDMTSLLKSVQADSYGLGIPGGRPYARAALDLRSIPPEPERRPSGQPTLIVTDTGI